MCIITVVLVAAFSSSSNGKWPKESHLTHDEVRPLRLLNGMPQLFCSLSFLQCYIKLKRYVIENVADDSMNVHDC